MAFEQTLVPQGFPGHAQSRTNGGEVVLFITLRNPPEDVEAPRLEGKDGSEVVERNVPLPDKAVLFPAVVVVVFKVGGRPFGQFPTAEDHDLTKVALVLVRK